MDDDSGYIRFELPKVIFLHVFGFASCYMAMCELMGEMIKQVKKLKETKTHHQIPYIT